VKLEHERILAGIEAAARRIIDLGLEVIQEIRKKQFLGLSDKAARKILENVPYWLWKASTNIKKAVDKLRSVK
jgi:hypothetical protein